MQTPKYESLWITYSGKATIIPLVYKLLCEGSFREMDGFWVKIKGAAKTVPFTSHEKQFHKIINCLLHVEE